MHQQITLKHPFTETTTFPQQNDKQTSVVLLCSPWPNNLPDRLKTDILAWQLECFCAELQTENGSQILRTITVFFGCFCNCIKFVGTAIKDHSSNLQK